LRAEILAGTAEETLLLLEHEPVITLGRSAAAGDVLAPDAFLASRGVTLTRASRGGAATYHGPGQLIGYPVVRLRRGVRAHNQGMAAAIRTVLAELGVSAHYRPDAPGLWVTSSGSSGPSAGPSGGPSAGPSAKICAFGVHVHRRVAIHGFALNLDPDLSAFRLIVPCGQTDAATTSVAALVGAAPTPDELAPRIAEALAREMQIPFGHDFEIGNTSADH
jgi:lipoyl(octanoyl) transferase